MRRFAANNGILTVIVYAETKGQAIYEALLAGADPKTLIELDNK